MSPYVKAVFSDFWGGVGRLRFTRFYTGAEGEYFSACCVPGDGSLVRARIDPSTKVLYSQRTAAPGAGSDYSSWTSHGTVSASGAVALCARAADVLLFYVAADTLTLKVEASADNGATWGAAATVATGAGAVTYLAAAFAAGGDKVLFWNEGATIYRSRYTGGAWGARTAWSNSAASISGLAAAYYGDWQVIVCGTAPTSTDAKVWGCRYGDGVNQAADTWSGLTEVTTAAAASSVTYLSPALAISLSWRLFFVEKYAGSLAYSRLQWSTQDIFSDVFAGVFREPVAFPYTGDYGVSCAGSALAGDFWLTAPAGVWHASYPLTTLDVSADLVEVEVEVVPAGSRCRLVLDNSGGKYNPAAAAGLAVGRGRRLQVSPGAYSSAGLEVSAGGPDFFVERMEYFGQGGERGGRGTVVLHCRDAWWLLESWRARRSFVWASGAKVVSQLATFIFARAGLLSSIWTNSPAWTNLAPAFTIHPGESGATAMRRLLAMVPDAVLFQGAEARVRYPQAADATDYAFGTDHAILAGKYRDLGPAVNRARSFGAGVFDEAFDFGEIEAVGERIDLVADLNLTTTTLAGNRAAYELRAAVLNSRDDELVVLPNVGQELYDVVSVTDAGAGLAAAPRRVLGLGWRLGLGARPGWVMRLTLGGV